jgi:hypothetical protein
MEAATPTRQDERLGTVVIDPRFNGPEASANGGYACGRLAAFVPGPAEITLRLPPPLATDLAVVADHDGGVRLLDHVDATVAEGRPAAAPAGEPPLRPGFADAAAASARNPKRCVRHALSGCFVCGPERDVPGDGLGVVPGPIDALLDVGAAPFQPDESVAVDDVVRPEILWAVLDCPSYVPSMWASDRISLLGRMSAVLHRPVLAGERLVVVGWLREVDGRKRLTSSALMDGDGETIARADATWIGLAG